MERAFAVDKAGLAKILARRGIEFAVLELLQNAFDENVTRVEAVLKPHGTGRLWDLKVTDNSPEGFADLAHAYTLFAESKKKANPEQRGRFNLGEKLVIAVCRTAMIRTTTGTVHFKGDTRRRTSEKTEGGSIFFGTLVLSKAQAEAVDAAVRSVLPPSGISLYWQGERISADEACLEFSTSLPTEIADEEGYLRPTRRVTRVEVLNADGPGQLYEMAIPVVETGDTFHYNVHQKVPLNTDRDNVRPAYLRELRTAVLAHTASQLTEEQAKGEWVEIALADPNVSPEAVQEIIAKRYGDKRVIRDPSDPEGTKLAVSKGYTLIEPGSFSKLQWENIKASGAALPAGKVTPSSKVVWSPGGKDVTIPEERWSEGARAHVLLASRIAQGLLGEPVHITLVSDAMRPYGACYGDYHLTYNVGRLGWAFFDRKPTRDEHIALLIHELGHQFSMDHLSTEYHDALCTLGVKLARLVRNAPDLLD